MESEVWVETLEPDSRQIVYANPITGQMVSEAPKGAIIKPMSNDQWWQLLDNASNDYYYYNPHTGDTVWDRPDSENILPLTNLGTVETTGTAGRTSESSVHQNTHRDLTAVEGVKPQRLPSVTSTDAFSVPLDTLSPLTVDFNGHRFPLFNEVDTTVDKQKFELDSHVTGYTSHSLPRMKIVSADSNSRSEVFDRISESTGYYSLEKNSTLATSSRHTRPSSYTTAVQEDVPVDRHQAGSFVIVSMSDISNDTSVPGSPHRSESAKDTRKISSPSVLDGSGLFEGIKPHNRSKSQGIPLAPQPPPLIKVPKMTRSVSMQADLGKYQDLAQHKKGFWRRKVTIANMLSWTKDPIKQPMILTRDKELRKEAVDLFKYI